MAEMLDEFDVQFAREQELSIQMHVAELAVITEARVQAKVLETESSLDYMRELLKKLDDLPSSIVIFMFKPSRTLTNAWQSLILDIFVQRIQIMSDLHFVGGLI